MWVRGDYDEWFLTSQHELAYLTLREVAASFLAYAAEGQVVLRLTPPSHWCMGLAATAAVPIQVPELDLAADEGAILDRNHGSTGNEEPNSPYYKKLMFSLSRLSNDYAI